MIDDATGPGLVPSPDGNAETHPGSTHGPEQDPDATRLGFARSHGRGQRRHRISCARVRSRPHWGKSEPLRPRTSSVPAHRRTISWADRSGAVTASSGCSAPAGWVPFTKPSTRSWGSRSLSRRCARRLPPIRRRHARSSAGSSRNCCSLARSRTATSSGSTTWVRWRASSTSPCPTSRATTCRPSSKPTANCRRRG